MVLARRNEDKAGVLNKFFASVFTWEDTSNIPEPVWKGIGEVLEDITELSICTTDGSYDGKTPNVASSPRRLSGPLRVVALGGPTEDKFDACAHE